MRANSTTENGRIRVAIVGSGLAGLSAAWLLSKDERFEVHLYEAHKEPGLGAHSVPVENPKTGEKIDVDIPLRIALGVELYKADSASSISSALTGMTYFRYCNIMLGEKAVPLMSLRNCLSPKFWSIMRDFLKFSYQGCRDYHDGSMRGQSLGQYFTKNRYSDEFVHQCVVPYLSVICTCAHTNVLNYPATVVVEYLLPILASPEPVRRVSEGVRLVAKEMVAMVKRLKCNVKVDSLSRLNDGRLRLVDSEGEEALFDKVVVCTQPQDAQRLVATCHPELSQLLARIQHDRSETILHTDAGLMPEDKANWSPMNLVVTGGETTCTCWLVKLQPSIGTSAIYQTWAMDLADKRPAPHAILAKSLFDRPLVTVETEEILAGIGHLQGAQSIYICGAYSLPGIPLLEQAAESGLRVAELLGCNPRPWTPPNKATVPQPSDVIYVVLWTIILGLASCLASLLAFSGLMEL